MTDTSKLTPAAFWHLCEAHDWLYMYSDDAQTWRAGAAEAAAIQAALRADLSLSLLYERWIAWVNGEAEHPTTLEDLGELKDQKAV